jgi:hypothetical protein
VSGTVFVTGEGRTICYSRPGRPHGFSEFIAQQAARLLSIAFGRRGSLMADVLVTAATFDEIAKADLAKMALEQEGIAAAIYDLPVRGNLTQIRLQVREPDLEWAQAILARASHKRRG